MIEQKDVHITTVMSGDSPERKYTDKNGNEVVKPSEKYASVVIQCGRTRFNVSSVQRHDLLTAVYGTKEGRARITKAMGRVKTSDHWSRKSTPKTAAKVDSTDTF